MKPLLKQTAIWLALVLGLMVCWIFGIILGSMLFPSELINMSDGGDNQAGPFMLLVCAINASAVLYFVRQTPQQGTQLLVTLFILFFGIQYFMSQIETLWFNDSLRIPINGVWAIVTGGAITSLLFASLTVWVTGRFTNRELSENATAKFTTGWLRNAALFTLLIWPLIYFVAGYYIAWQFADLREFYTGSSEKASFLSMMKENFASHLYSFQALRGILWLLIARMVFRSLNGPWLKQGLVLAMLLVAVGCSPLLIPNPAMPEAVRLAHLLETSLSGIVLGIVLAWLLVRIPDKPQ